MKRTLILVGILTLLNATAFADIANPEAKPKTSPVPKKNTEVSSRMKIKLDKDATEAKLILPKSKLKELKAQLEDLDESSNDTAAVNSGVSRSQTIMTGVFLSLALVFGGIWFVRSGKTGTTGGKTLVILAVLSGIGSAATFVYANVGPPPEARKITGKMFSEKMHRYEFGTGDVKIEISKDSNMVELIVPDEHEKTKSEE